MRAHNDELVGASDDALDALFAESDDAVAAARAVLAAAVAPPPPRCFRAGTAVRRRLGGGGGARAARRRAEEEAVCAVCLGPLRPDAPALLARVPRGLRRRDGRFRPGDSGAAACPTCPVCREPYRERRSSSSGAVAKVDVS